MDSPINEKEYVEIDIREYLVLLKKWAWLLLLISLISGSGAFLLSNIMTPVYEASSTLYINEAPGSGLNEYTALLTSERLANTYSQLVTSKQIINTLFSRLEINDTYDDFIGNINVEVIRDTQLIKVTFEHKDPVFAANVTNNLVEVFIEQITAMQSARYKETKESLFMQISEQREIIDQTEIAMSLINNENANEKNQLDQILTQYRQTYANLMQSYEDVQIAEAQSTSNIFQVDKATIPEKPVRPNKILNTLVAASVGLMVSIGIVLLIESFDTSLKSSQEVIRKLGLPVLGIIASHENSEKLPITLLEPRSPVSEAFRSLRTNIRYTTVDHVINSIVVTSPSPGEGKSVIAVNLAIVLAQSGMRVILVDADMRKPVIHNRLGLTNNIGISSLFVVPEIKLDGYFQNTKVENLLALSSGPLPPNPSELLGSNKMLDILNELRKNAEILIIDAPPILAVTDAVVLASHADAVLLAVEAGKTEVEGAQYAITQLNRNNSNLLGVVLNNVDLDKQRYGLNNGYYYYQSETKKRKKGLFGRKKK